jgi:hypothetical protein
MIIRIALTLLSGLKNIIESKIQVTSKHIPKYVYKKKQIIVKNNKKISKKKLAKLSAIFFDSQQACPGEIKNCQFLRDRYEEEIKKLEKYKMCTLCNISFVKQKIIASFDID